MEANAKQERRLARQRGAGPRPLTDNAAFAFSFAAPSAPSAPSPKSAKRSQNALKTPATNRKRKRASQAPIATPAGADTAEAEQVDELSPDAPVPINSAELPQLKRVSIPLLAPNRLREERPAPSPDRRPPREERGRSRTRKSIVSVSYSQSRSRLDALSEENEDELTPAPARRSRETRSTPVAEPSPGQDELSPAVGPVVTSRMAVESATATSRDPEDNDSGLAPAESPSHRRRSELDIRREPARELLGIRDELTPGPAHTRQQHSEAEILPDAEPELELDVSDLDDLSRRSSASLRSPLAVLDINVNPRAPKQRPTKTAQSRQSEAGGTPADENVVSRPRKKRKTARSGKKSGPTVPITIYRRTVPDDDPLGIDPSPIPSMHPSDVLSQISSEVLNRYMATAAGNAGKAGNTAAGKKALRQRLQALESFREGLADSLRGITFARHAMFTFSSEVRRERKRKRELREVLVGLRRERDGVELEIDRVRAGTEKAREERESREETERDLLAIAEVVGLGRETGGRVDDEGSGDVVEEGPGSLLQRLRAFRGSLVSSMAS